MATDTDDPAVLRRRRLTAERTRRYRQHLAATRLAAKNELTPSAIRPKQKILLSIRFEDPEGGTMGTEQMYKAALHGPTPIPHERRLSRRKRQGRATEPQKTKRRPLPLSPTPRILDVNTTTSDPFAPSILLINTGRELATHHGRNFRTLCFGISLFRTTWCTVASCPLPRLTCSCLPLPRWHTPELFPVPGRTKVTDMA